MMTIAISKIVFRPKVSAKAPQNMLPKNAPKKHTEIRIPSFAIVILPGVTSLITTIGSSVKCRRPNSLVCDRYDKMEGWMRYQCSKNTQDRKKKNWSAQEKD